MLKIWEHINLWPNPVSILFNALVELALYAAIHF